MPLPPTGFAPGTFVQTTKGLRQIERLVPGEDEMEATDGTAHPLLTVIETTGAAVHIAPLAMGPAHPQRPLTLGAETHLMATGRLVSRATDQEAVLLPASALTSLDGIEAATDTRLLTPVCAHHLALRVEGITSETGFIPADADPDVILALPEDHRALRHIEQALMRLPSSEATRLIERLNEKNRSVVAEG
ncbi:MAG: Hint domain-containing protein [Shimia sp.]